METKRIAVIAAIAATLAACALLQVGADVTAIQTCGKAKISQDDLPVVIDKLDKAAKATRGGNLGPLDAAIAELPLDQVDRDSIAALLPLVQQQFPEGVMDPAYPEALAHVVDICVAQLRKRVKPAEPVVIGGDGSIFTFPKAAWRVG